MIIGLIARQIKKHITSISEYFPKPYEHSGKNIKVKLKHLIMRQKHI